MGSNSCCGFCALFRRRSTTADTLSVCAARVRIQHTMTEDHVLSAGFPHHCGGSASSWMPRSPPGVSMGSCYLPEGLTHGVPGRPALSLSAQSLFSWLVPDADSPDSLLLWRVGQTPRLLRVVPDDYWHEPPPALIDSWADQFDIRTLASAEEALRELLLAKAAGPGWASPPLHRALPQLRTRCSGNSRMNGPASLPTNRLPARRDTTGRGRPRAARSAFQAGESELGIHLAYLAASRSTDADLPYASIVALNEHAANVALPSDVIANDRPADIHC